MELTFWWYFLFFFFAIFIVAAKNSDQVYASKKPTKQKQKNFEMYGLHMYVIFLPES